MPLLPDLKRPWPDRFGVFLSSAAAGVPGGDEPFGAADCNEDDSGDWGSAAGREKKSLRMRGPREEATAGGRASAGDRLTTSAHVDGDVRAVAAAATAAAAGAVAAAAAGAVAAVAAGRAAPTAELVLDLSLVDSPDDSSRDSLSSRSSVCSASPVSQSMC